MKTLLIITITFALAACTAVPREPEDLTPHMGKTLAELQELWGPATAIYDMRDGTRQVLWTRNVPGGGTGISMQGTQLIQAKSRKCTRVVVINEDNLATGFNYEGFC